MLTELYHLCDENSQKRQNWCHILVTNFTHALAYSFIHKVDKKQQNGIKTTDKMQQSSVLLVSSIDANS